MTTRSVIKDAGGIVVAHTDGSSVDRLLTGLPDQPHYLQLMHWAQTQFSERLLHQFMPDYHRLQIEYWVWSHLTPPTDRRVLDIGAVDRRGWVGPHYRTFGPPVTEPDIHGDLLAVEQWPVGFAGEWDVVLCTEVLEHCDDPFGGAAALAALLRDGGILLLTTPFLWPDHRTDDYPDYWRFTEQGLRRLLAPHFADVTVEECQWSRSGVFAFHLMRQSECMGIASDIVATPGFLVRAVK